MPNKVLQEPYSIEAEQSLLGSMIMDRDAIGKVLEIIDEKSFYLDSHRRIFNGIVSLYEKNEPIDILTLTNELKKRQELEVVGDIPYITEILDSVVSSANVVHYAKIVRDKYTLRELIKSGNEIIESAYSDSYEVDELLDKAEQLIFSIKEKRIERGFIQIGTLLGPTFELIDRMSRDNIFLTGIPSGFKDIDKITAGFQPSDFIIVAARPSMGKSAFCLNIAENLAIEKGIGVGIFSLEMSKESIVMRMLCSQAEVSSHKIRTRTMDKKDYSKLAAASGSLHKAPIFIDDTPGIPLLELRAKARRLKSKENIQLLIVDYLQLVSGPKGETRQQEISAISGSLKALAKELNIPVIAVSQLSRAVEARVDKRPVLSDLRESGAIEQDADLVIFIYREERYKPTKDKGIAEIIIAKHRNGPIGKAYLQFTKDYTKFNALTEREVTELEEAEVE